jgi:PAS domain S-box-containing protein
LSHKDKISSPRKSIYFLAGGAILFIIIIVAASILVQQRMGVLYQNIFKSGIKVGDHISKARALILINANQKSKETVRNIWDELDQAEVLADQLTNKDDHLGSISFSVNTAPLKSSIQQMQVLLLDYRALCSQVITSSTLSITDPLIKSWHNKYEQIEEQNRVIEKEFQNVLSQQARVFLYIQIGFVTATVILIIIALFIFYRYQLLQGAYLRKMEEASTYLEVGLKKTTIAEVALQESQRQLNTLINNLPGMVYRFKGDAIWSMDFVSDKSLVLTGYRPEELINDKEISYYDIIHPADRKKIFEQVQKSIEERKTYQLVYRIKTTSGYEKWVWEQGVGVFNETNDELIALEGFITDITEQKSIEDQLNVQSNALEAAANGIVIMDSDGKVIWCNTAFINLTGYSLKEIIGNELTILKSPNFPAEIYTMMWESVSGGQVWHGELINRKKDGTDYYDDTTITPVKDTEGKIKYYVSIKQDITSRKMSEASIIESETRFRTLYENATIGLFRTSPGGQILMANPALLKIFGVEYFSELADIQASEVYVDPLTRDYFQRDLKIKGRINGFDSKWKKKDGTIIYVRESARIVRDENERVLYYEGTVEDISEKKKAEEEIILAKEKAEKSDRLKTEFLAQMSHEIRTPLNVILNFSSLLKEELQQIVDEELKSSFDVIELEGKRIMRTVELILNMSELQTGNYNFRAGRIDLLEVINKYHRDFEHVANQKKTSLNTICNTDNSILLADEYSINQIFYHLIDNAVKYTTDGKVDIIINRDINDRLCVDITDTGIGIDEEYMTQLFMPFTKEEKGYTRNYEGNGLGLALVKRYCELNSADIKVNSSKGKGTTFRITFANAN